MNKQASLLAAAAATVEVSRLRQSLGRAEEELSLMKRQLEENKGKSCPIHVSYKRKINNVNKKTS